MGCMYAMNTLLCSRVQRHKTHEGVVTVGYGLLNVPATRSSLRADAVALFRYI